MEATRTFRADTGTPREARQFVRRVLDDGADEETFEVASILTSELVTNAVVHAGTPLDVRIVLSDEGVRVAVRDGDPFVPAPFEPDAEAPSGRGLFLVDHLAASWGVDPDPHGKTVWFTLPGRSAEPARQHATG